MPSGSPPRNCRRQRHIAPLQPLHPIPNTGGGVRGRTTRASVGQCSASGIPIWTCKRFAVPTLSPTGCLAGVACGTTPYSQPACIRSYAYRQASLRRRRQSSSGKLTAEARTVVEFFKLSSCLLASKRKPQRPDLSRSSGRLKHCLHDRAGLDSGVSRLVPETGHFFSCTRSDMVPMNDSPAVNPWAQMFGMENNGRAE